MSQQITTAFVQQYQDNVLQLSQQKGSRLRDRVRIKNDFNGKVAFMERLGSTAAVKKTVRHGDTPLVESQHSRRRITVFDYEWADLVDDQDKIRLLITPESEYAQAASWAMGRAMDDEILVAANGNAYAGEDGSTVVPLPTAQKIAHGGVGLTLAKLLTVIEKLDTADVDPDEQRYIVYSPVDRTTLLNTTEVKSADYNTVKALAAGQIDTFMGLKFLLSNRLRLSTDGSSRAVMAWLQSGMALAIGKDVKTRMDERFDKSYALQVYLCMTIGATRVEDEKVIEVSVTP
jgi:hypothetical protein